MQTPSLLLLPKETLQKFVTPFLFLSPNLTLNKRKAINKVTSEQKLHVFD